MTHVLSARDTDTPLLASTHGAHTQDTWRWHTRTGFPHLVVASDGYVHSTVVACERKRKGSDGYVHSTVVACERKRKGSDGYVNSTVVACERKKGSLNCEN